MSNKTENTVANPMPINCRAMKKLSIVSLPFKISNKYPPKICIFFESRGYMGEKFSVFSDMKDTTLTFVWV